MKPLREAQGLVSASLSVFSTVLSMMTLETKLAVLSIGPLLLTLSLLWGVLLALWLSILAFIGYGLMLLSNNPWVSIGLVLLINVAVSWVLLHQVRFHLRNMQFEKTRAYFHHDQTSANPSN